MRRDDIVWTYSGVRPLYDDGASKAQEATRDYVLKADAPDGKAPLINIFGGKITTYRRLSEHMLEKIEGFLGRKGKSWTAGAALPGGDFPVQRFEEELEKLKAAYPFLDMGHARRLWRLYGTSACAMLGPARSMEDLGHHFGADLYEVEVRYLVAHEWAITAEDILWRRTKLGLHFSTGDIMRLEAFMAQETAGRRKAAAE